jgi:hypothetical protein
LLFYSVPVKADDVSLGLVMSAPERYSGVELTMTVGLHGGFEWQELVCSSCNIRHKIWVEFDPNLKGAGKLKRIDRFDSLYRVRIRGVFIGEKGHYGHLNGYEYQFLIREVLSAKRLWQMSPRTANVPDAVEAVACLP